MFGGRNFCFYDCKLVILPSLFFRQALNVDKADREHQEHHIRIDATLIGRCEAQRLRMAVYRSKRGATTSAGASAPSSRRDSRRTTSPSPSRRGAQPLLKSILVRQRPAPHYLKPTPKRSTSVSCDVCELLMIEKQRFSFLTTFLVFRLAD